MGKMKSLEVIMAEVNDLVSSYEGRVEYSEAHVERIKSKCLYEHLEEVIEERDAGDLVAGPSPNAKFKKGLPVMAERKDYIIPVCPACRANDDILVIRIDREDKFYYCTCGEGWTVETMLKQAVESTP